MSILIENQEKQMNTFKSLGRLLAAALFITSLTAIGVSAQGYKSAHVVPVPAGVEAQPAGVVSQRDGDTFKIRDIAGAETVVLITNATKVSSHSKGLRGKTAYPVTYIMRGLRIEAKGVGDSNGNLVAKWVRFSEEDLRSAQALEQTDELAQENQARISAAEENARKLAAQIEETTAIANIANAKADAAQATANQAFKDAAMANNRINGLDDYDLIKTIPILFAVGSSKLNAEAISTMEATKVWVDEQKAAGNTKGWLVQVVGFADSSGKTAKNTALSNRRAKAVIDRMVMVYDFDLRR